MLEPVEPENGAIAENQKKLMPRMMRAKTAGQAQEVTDNIIQPTSKTGKHKPEEQIGVSGKAPINGNQGSNIKKGITKENSVLITTGVKSKLVKPENGTITENQKKLMLRMTRANTAGQAQDVTDYIKHPTSKSGKPKSGEQSGVTGNVLIDGIQGIIIDKGNSKKKQFLILLGQHWNLSSQKMARSKKTKKR
eukprot:15366883-Ditylum_brightwellii.AAC.1